MARITFVIPDNVEQEFRRIVGAVEGMNKGALGKALTEGALMWIKENSHRSSKNSLRQLKNHSAKTARRRNVAT